MVSEVPALAAPDRTASGSNDGDAPENAWLRLAALPVHATALALVLLTLVLVGQPLYANDTWIHLALGEAFLSHGPWLDTDPHLFAAPGPPAPASWLGAVALFSVWECAGFTGLRLLHVAIVGVTLTLAWVVVRRAGASAALASSAVVVFVVLSTYRLVQLRPDLFSIVLTLGLYLWLIAPRAGPRPAAIVASAAVGMLWANVHAGFLLGPILLLGTGFVLWVVDRVPWLGVPADGGQRARRVLLAGGAMLAGSLLNPAGPAAHWAVFAAGDQTVALSTVIDEWSPTRLLSRPVDGLPPSWAAWWAAWLCVAACVVGVVGFLVTRGRRRADYVDDDPTASAIDPALCALAVAGLIAALLAARFLWLGIFPLALFASVLADVRRSRRASLVMVLVTAVVTPIIAWAHLSIGDWPMVSKAVVGGADYREPYRASKYYAHAMWFLADSGVEGRIYNDYLLGGFMSFWLAPELRMASSGTMNVEREAMEANFAIGSRAPVREGESYEALLDRQGMDLFLGTGLPVHAGPGRPIASTVRHLEHASGWLLVFRDLRSSVYLRQNERNTANLERIAAYYDRAGVPFDRERGFEPERVIVRAPAWALSRGVVPVGFDGLLESVRRDRALSRIDEEIHRLALLYATLGLYERALEVDRSILRMDRSDVLAARRILWNLMQLGRYAEALTFAQEVEAGPLGVEGGVRWSGAVEQIMALPAESARPQAVALMPLLDGSEASSVLAGVVEPEARRDRPRR